MVAVQSALTIATGAFVARLSRVCRDPRTLIGPGLFTGQTTIVASLGSSLNNPLDLPRRCVTSDSRFKHSGGSGGGPRYWFFIPALPLGFRVAHSDDIRRRAIGLYDAAKLSCRATAARMSTDYGVNVTPQTVARWAREEGKNRSVGEPRLPLSGHELKPFYDAGVPVSRLAERFHVSQTFVRDRLREVGTQMRRSGTRYTLLTKGRLQSMYLTRGMSAKQIAMQVGCSQMTVYYRLRIYRIPRRRKPAKG